MIEQAEQRFTLDELATLVDLPRRTVRYYIQIGLLSRPGGAGRGAHYTTRHLDELVEIRKWQQSGLSLERIRELRMADGADALLPPPRMRERGAVEVRSHILVNDGVEIIVDPKRANMTPEEVKGFAHEVIKLYEKLNTQRGR